MGTERQEKDESSWAVGVKRRISLLRVEFFTRKFAALSYTNFCAFLV